MIDIKYLSDISQFANFETYNLGNKEIIVYDDHRCILTALFEARKLGIIDKSTNLITFDRHDDARPIHPDTDKLLDKWVDADLSEISSRDFKSFVEFDISERDDDWVNVGMELGLINNVVNIGCDENFNIQEWHNSTYADKVGRNHLGFVIGHLRDALNRHGGSIADVAKKSNDRLRAVIGYNIESLYPSLQDDVDFVLDFDLDCFTTECMGKRFAWPESIFLKEYAPDSAAGYFMHDMISKSKFITICREPSFCGGIGEADKILGYLDRFFLHGCLGSSPIK